MKKTKQTSDPQLTLGLIFKGHRIIQYLRYRISKFLIFLDEVSFWRLPLLYLVLFCDGTLGVWLFSTILQSDLVPPTIPLLFYSPQTDTLIAPGDTLILYFVLLLLHVLSLFISSKLFYRFRQLSVFLMLTCLLSTLLFAVTIYKSISLTLP